MNSVIRNDMREIMDAQISWEKLNGKTILITGATGMIPAYMVYALLYRNETFMDFSCKILLHVRDMGKAKRLFGEFIGKQYLNISTESLLNMSFSENIDYIIHGASPASPQLFMMSPVQVVEPNVIGTYHLLEETKEMHIKGFLLFSSGDVYGQTEENEIISEQTLGTVDQLNIRNVYAESKRMAEMICRSYFEQHSVPAKSARISHTYGPTVNFKNDRRVFSEFVQNILNDEDIIMKSAGTAVRPFCYLTDAAIGLFMILLEGQAGEAYNLCNDLCSVSIRELAEILVGLFPEKQLKVVCQVREKNDYYKESLVQRPCTVDNSKLRALGWKPVVDIKEGFKRTISSFMENKE